MHIESDWTKAIITKIVTKIIKSKAGINSKIDLGNIDVEVHDGEVEVSLSAKAKIPKSELFKMLTEKL